MLQVSNRQVMVKVLKHLAAPRVLQAQQQRAKGGPVSPQCPSLSTSDLSIPTEASRALAVLQDSAKKVVVKVLKPGVKDVLASVVIQRSATVHASPVS